MPGGAPYSFYSTASTITQTLISSGCPPIWRRTCTVRYIHEKNSNPPTFSSGMASRALAASSRLRNRTRAIPQHLGVSSLVMIRRRVPTCHRASAFGSAARRVGRRGAGAGVSWGGAVQHTRHKSKKGVHMANLVSMASSMIGKVGINSILNRVGVPREGGGVPNQYCHHIEEAALIFPSYECSSPAVPGDFDRLTYRDSALLRPLRGPLP